MTSLDTDATAVGAEADASGSRRWWAAVVTGAVVSLPFGWLLSYGAALVALLGLFFFALFGLVIGAVMYRVAAPAPPVSRGQLIAGVAIVVAVCWGVSMWKEVRDFPGDKAAYTLGEVTQLPEGVTREQFAHDVEQFVRDTLDHQYGGAGLIGYARWVLDSSRMEYPVETRKEPIKLKAIQYKWWWVVRVVLSIALLAFGIHAQVAPLRRASEEHAASDAPSGIEEAGPSSEGTGPKSDAGKEPGHS